MINIDSYKKLPRPDIARLAEAGSITDAAFTAVDYDGIHGMVLTIAYGEESNPHQGILYKQDGKPRLFTTPQAIMMNADRLGIKKYRIDAREWQADYYKVYDAQVRRAREKRKDEA